MSCKIQVLLEHCAGQVNQQLNKMSALLDVLSTPVWHDCNAALSYTVQLGQQVRGPSRLSYGVFYGSKGLVHPNYIKKQKHIFLL